MYSMLILVGCNTAPLGYTSDAVVGGGSEAWDHPTNDACEGKSDAERLGEFDWCAKYPGFPVIDDPIYLDCANIPSDLGDLEELEVFEVFDGLLARAYSVDQMRGHELVHDTWNGVDVLVDW